MRVALCSAAPTPRLLSAPWCVALVALAVTLGLNLEVGMADSRTPSVAPARVCRWSGGKQAAASLRFDDSHPTHAEVAVPMLNEMGLIGTFLVNPGNDSYKKHQALWEGPILQRGHELANHTWNHRGAKTDAEADQQIGATTELLLRLQPGQKQITFEPGGATLWLQRKPFEFFISKYHLADINDTKHTDHTVLSCTVAHSWFNLPAFSERLEKTIAEGGWFQPYFHQIDETGHLRLPPPEFRKTLEMVAAHRADLWQAGMTAIYEYEQERESASVWPQVEGDDALRLELMCGTDPNLFTQPLTIEVDLPAGVKTATVLDSDGKALACRIEEAAGRPVLRFEAPPADSRLTVRATGIGAAARPRIPEVRAPGAHPFVVFSAADRSALRAKTSDPLAKAMWDRILQHADEALASDAAGEPRDDHPWVRMGEELSPIEALAFAYALTQKAEYAAAGVPRLVTLAGEDWWYTGTSEMLNTSAATNTMGLAYDWLYDAMTETQRAQVRASMVEHGLKRMVEATEKGEWWTKWFHCNWGAVIYGEIGMAALALLGDEPEAPEWVRLCERKTWRYFDAIGPDGSWGESASYGAYAWNNAVGFADGLRRVTGDNLFDSPRLRQLPRWFITLLEPGGRNFVPFSNCQKGSGGPMALLFRLAHEYGDGQAQLVAKQMAEGRHGDPLSFLWYDPAVETKPLSESPLDTLFPNLSWAFLRSSWEDPKATLFGLKGGHKEWDHSHHDTNSFVLYALGKPLLIDLFYPHQIWGCLTEAHNTIMVNGKDQSGHVNVAGGRDDPEHKGIVADLVEAPWYARIVGDASLAYDPADLTGFVREIMYLRQSGAGMPPDYFVMLDDVETPAPSNLDWMLHTYGETTFHGNTVTVTQDDAAVDVTLISPENLTHEVMEKSFEETNVPKPFDTAPSIRTIKLRPSKAESLTFFLSVLAPRAASAPAPFAIEAVRQPNTLGAQMTSGVTRDLALFALDAPAISANGVEAIGRSCFVRTSGGRVQGMVLHNGQRISSGGVLLFETNSAGHAVLTFGDDGVEAKLDVYDSDQVRIHVDRAPAKVLVNGEERPFEYEVESGCVKLDYYAIHEVRVQY